MSALTPDGSRNLGRFGALLAALLALLAAAPFAERTDSNPQLLSIAFSVVLAAGVYSVSRRPRQVVVGLAIALPALAIEWTSNYYPTTTMVMTNLALLGVFVTFVAVVIFKAVLSETRVTLDTIFGGIAVYLLLGLAWSFAYAAIEHVAPGSLPYDGMALQELRSNFEFVFPELIYFSFVTLTTLGYGDMSPISQPARMVAIFEAVTGQLYVAIFIARLVALQITQQRGASRN